MLRVSDLPKRVQRLTIGVPTGLWENAAFLGNAYIAPNSSET